MRKDINSIIEDNREWIQFNLKWHSIHWIGTQLGIDKTTMWRHAKLNNWKGKGMRESLTTDWTPEMLEKLKELFPVTFNRVLADQLNVSMRTLIRKARELNIDKESGFLKKRRKEIGQLAKSKRKPNDQATIERITNSGIPYRFKKGHSCVEKLPDELRDTIDLLKKLNRKINNHEKHNNRPSQSPV